jgi:DNA-directed RNA polymerase subunit RPC12/RpoP
MNQIKCPQCGWSARIDWLASKKMFICRHCGNTFEKVENKEIKK